MDDLERIRIENTDPRVSELELKRGLTLYLNNDPKPKYLLYLENDSIFVRDEQDKEQTYRIFRISYRHIDMDRYLKDAVDYRVFHGVIHDEAEIDFMNRVELIAYINYWKKHFLNWICIMMNEELNSVKFYRHKLHYFVKFSNYIAYDKNTYHGYGVIIKFLYSCDGVERAKRFFIPLYLSGLDIFHDHKALFDLDVILNFMFEVPNNRRLFFDKRNNFVQNYTNKSIDLILSKWN